MAYILACRLLIASLAIGNHAKASVQASDFVPTPLAEDQGAITRFFNGNQPQKAGGVLWTCNDFTSELITSALLHGLTQLALRRGVSLV